MLISLNSDGQCLLILDHLHCLNIREKADKLEVEEGYQGKVDC